MKTKTRYAKAFLVLTCLLSIAIFAPAATTKVFTEKTFGDFNRGETRTSSLSSEGQISPAPAYESLWKGRDELAWKIVEAPKNTLYFSTGNEGKIFVIEKSKVELFCDLEELAVFAMAVDKNGVLYAGASPGGKIYRIPEKNKAEIFFDTGQKYIWDIAFDKNDHLLAATGVEGKLFKIDPKGKGETFYQTSDKNIMDILILSGVPDQSIYIATHDKGRVYRITDKDKAFVLFDSGMDEIRAIVEGEPGYFYAALNSLKTPPPPRKTEDEPKKQESEDDPEGDGEEPRAIGLLELPIIMGRRSSIVKLDISGFVWQILNPQESPVHSLIYDSVNKTLYSGIGEKGKLFSIDGPNRFTVVFSTDEKYILSFLQKDDFLYIGTAQTPNIYKVALKDRSRGEYVSPVHDAKTAVKWGRIHLEGDIPPGANVRFSARSGNTEEPDITWSDWGKEASFENNHGFLNCPVGRFSQYKLLMTAKDSKAFPLIKKIDCYYVPPNRAPEIEKVDVAPSGKAPAPKTPVKDKADEKSDEEAGKTDNSASIDPSAHSNQKKMRVAWKARDPEGDKLLFNLYFKGENENIWKELVEKYDKPLYIFSTEPFPDGLYQIKVIATDLPSNPPDVSLETESVSDFFVIDNSPPELIKGPSYKRLDKNTVVIQATAQDKISIISAAQFSVNAKEWFRVNPDDGIFDSQTESFSFVIRDIKEEEALITFMVTDAEGNTLVEKLLIKPKDEK